MRTLGEIEADQRETAADVDAGSKMLAALSRENLDLKNKLFEARTGRTGLSLREQDQLRERLQETQESIGDTKTQLTTIYRTRENLHLEWQAAKRLEYEDELAARRARPSTPYEKAFIRVAQKQLAPEAFQEIQRLTFESLKG